MKYQDIHTTDSALWKQYQDYMAKGEYDAAKAILAQTQLDNKRIDASLFNTITTELTRLQNQGKDSTWSKNTMAVQDNPPANMQDGECYCKTIKKYTPYKVKISGISNIPQYYIENTSDKSLPLEFSIFDSSKRFGFYGIRDGVYQAYNYVGISMRLLPIYTRYGALKTGKTEIYINGEIYRTGTQMDLTNWVLYEDLNQYQCKISSYTMRYNYIPFEVPYMTNGAEIGDDASDIYYAKSDVDIMFTHSINEEEGNLYLRCDINTH